MYKFKILLDNSVLPQNCQILLPNKIFAISTFILPEKTPQLEQSWMAVQIEIVP